MTMGPAPARGSEISVSSASAEIESQVRILNSIDVPPECGRKMKEEAQRAASAYGAQ